MNSPYPPYINFFLCTLLIVLADRLTFIIYFLYAFENGNEIVFRIVFVLFNISINDLISEQTVAIVIYITELE